MKAGEDPRAVDIQNVQISNLCCLLAVWYPAKRCQDINVCNRSLAQHSKSVTEWNSNWERICQLLEKAFCRFSSAV